MPKRSKIITGFLVLTLVAQGVLMIMRFKTQREIEELQKERQKMIVPLPKVDPQKQVAAFLAGGINNKPYRRSKLLEDALSDGVTDEKEIANRLERRLAEIKAGLNDSRSEH